MAGFFTVVILSRPGSTKSPGCFWRRGRLDDAFELRHHRGDLLARQLGALGDLVEDLGLAPAFLDRVGFAAAFGAAFAAAFLGAAFAAAFFGAAFAAFFLSAAMLVPSGFQVVWQCGFRGEKPV